MILYHYTSLYHLPLIEADGMIKATESNFELLQPNAGPPVVWLLDTAEPGDLDHGLEGSLYDKKQVRFTVDVPAIRWLDWPVAISGMRRDERERLVRTGGGIEAASHWYVLPGRIPRSRWLDVTTLPERPGRMVARHNGDGSVTWVSAAEAMREASEGEVKRRVRPRS